MSDTTDTNLDEINDRIAEVLREQAGREAAEPEADTPKDNSTVVRALGMLAEASRWFSHKGWKTLPDSRRGWLIVQWGAEVAWQGNPANPERGARAWCCKWQPLLRLKQNKAKLDRIIAEAARTKTLWAPDIGGATLEITVSDLVALGFRFLGACDDPNYDARNATRKAKNAACHRRRRAANSTGRKRGRPALNLSPEEKRTRRLAQEAERKRRLRASAKNASSHIESITAVTHFSVTPPSLTPWAELNMSRAKYYRLGLHKRASPAPMPNGETGPCKVSHDGIDLAKFGITAIRVMRGTDVVRAWNAPCSLDAARGAPMAPS
jgi:hypothetical protein